MEKYNHLLYLSGIFFNDTKVYHSSCFIGRRDTGTNIKPVPVKKL